MDRRVIISGRVAAMSRLTGSSNFTVPNNHNIKWVF